MAEQRATLRLGKNEPKQMPLEERRRRAKTRRLRSVIESQRLRVEFLRDAISKQADPLQKRYLGEELERAQERWHRAKDRLDRMMHLSVN